MAKYFIDWHHGGLGRSLILTLQDRLGHEVWGPDGTMCEFANTASPGAWGMPMVAASGGIPEHLLNQHGNVNTCSKEQFMDMDWDAVVISRPESVVPMRMLIDSHRQRDTIKRIGQAGNEGQVYDWGWIPNFLSSDYLSYLRAPKEINKLHYMQEVGRQFQPESFTPIAGEYLHTINTYINCLSSFTNWTWDKDMSWWGSKCPHCDGQGAISPTVNQFELWNSMKSSLSGFNLMDYGIVNTGGVIEEKQLPQKYIESALSWCFKHYDGYGHSIAQSVSMGRLCMIPRRLHKYRTANQFLIPNLTCLEVEPNLEDCVSTIRWFTESLDRVNDYSEACFHAAKGLFNWKHEAERVRTFLSQLR